MVRGYQDRYDARVPRTIFEHGHNDGFPAFPPQIHDGGIMLILAHLPDNWNGFDAFYLKLLGGTTEASTLDVTINAGTCDEAYDTHSQTVDDTAISFVAGEYECFDLMTLFETVIALMASDDDLYITVATPTTNEQYGIGVVIEES